MTNYNDELQAFRDAVNDGLNEMFGSGEYEEDELDEAEPYEEEEE